MNLIESQTCRTCLQNNAATLPLKTQIKNCTSRKTYKDVLQDLTEIKFIDQHEVYMPQSICQSCSNQLKSSYDFILQAEECNDELMEMLTKHDDYHDCLEEKTIDILTDENLNTKEDFDKLFNDFAHEIEIKEEEETLIKIELSENVAHEQQTIDCAEDQQQPKQNYTEHNVSKENIQLIKSFYINRADYATENNKTKCYFCQYSTGRKYDLFRHIRRSHMPKITELRCEMTTKDKKADCSLNIVLEEEELIRYLINLKESAYNKGNTTKRDKLMTSSSKADSKFHTMKSRSNKCRFCDCSYTKKHDLLRHFKKKHKQAINELKKKINVQGADSSNLESQEDASVSGNYTADRDDDDDEFMHSLLNMKKKIPLACSKWLPRSCDVCGKVLKNADVLRTHKRFVHASEDDYFPCTLCDNKYKRKKQLKFHMENKHSTTAPPKRTKSPPRLRKYMCSYCSHCFTTTTSLNIHVKRRHTGERPYKCNICNRTFLIAFHLKIHNYIHSGERPYKCSYCPKTFRMSGSLMKHKRVHTNERPYKCTECPKRFSTNSNLKSHKRVHKNSASFNCNVCEKIFDNAALLNLHRINKDHPDEVN